MDEDRPPRVTVDVFERGSGVPAELQRLGAAIGFAALPSGDYRIARDVLVERKSVPDLHGSLSGRLFAQVGRIRDEAAFPYLLVEGGDLDDGPRHPNAIRGALLAIAELGVSVIRSRDVADSALWLHRLAIRHARRRARAMRPAAAPLPGVAALAGIPGIPTAVARALIERLASAASRASSRQALTGGRPSKGS